MNLCPIPKLSPYSRQKHFPIHNFPFNGVKALLEMVYLKLLTLSTLLTCSWCLESFMMLPLVQRQDGEHVIPAYLNECHECCGMALSNFSVIKAKLTEKEKENTVAESKFGGHCTFPSFLYVLHNCLKCALTYNIWQEYGDEVTAAASACGENATPSPSLAPPPNVSVGSMTASTTVIATTSSTVSSTSTQSHAATTGASGVVSSNASTVSSYEDFKLEKGYLTHANLND